MMGYSGALGTTKDIDTPELLMKDSEIISIFCGSSHTIFYKCKIFFFYFILFFYFSKNSKWGLTWVISQKSFFFLNIN